MGSPFLPTVTPIILRLRFTSSTNLAIRCKALRWKRIYGQLEQGNTHKPEVHTRKTPGAVPTLTFAWAIILLVLSIRFSEMSSASERRNLGSSFGFATYELCPRDKSIISLGFTIAFCKMEVILPVLLHSLALMRRDLCLTSSYKVNLPKDR